MRPNAHPPVIEVPVFARRVGKLGRLRERMIRMSGGDEAAVDRYLADYIGRGARHVAERYGIEQSARLDRIGEIRRGLSEVYEGVIDGRRSGPDAARDASRLFRELETELKELLPPNRFLEKEGVVQPPPVAQAAAAPTPAVTAASDLSHLSPERRTAVNGVAERHADLVRRIIFRDDAASVRAGLDELDGRLQAEGIPADERARLRAEFEDLQRRRRDALYDPNSPTNRAALLARLTDLETNVRAMNEAIEGRRRDLVRLEADARARGSDDYAGDLRRRLRRFNEWVQNEGGAENIARRLRVAVEADAGLQARAGDAAALRRLWVEYDSLPRESLFPDYVRNRMNEMKGLTGEMTVGFNRGERFDFLKAPDEFVTRQGTDMIALDRTANNEGLIIDSKLMNRAVLEDVGALTRNVVKNLVDDVAMLDREFAIKADLPPEVRAGMDRLKQAVREIEDLPEVRAARDPVSGEYDSRKIADPAVQAKINGTLQKYRFRRVVIDEGGVIQSVSDDLKRLRIRLYP